MATPHVTGAAALVLAINPSLTPPEVAATIFGNSTANKITNPGAGSPNRLLFVAQGTPPPTLTLYRFWSGRDHISTTSTSFPGYRREGSLGKVRTSHVAGTRALYQCLVGGWDYVTTHNSDCSGSQIIGLIGFVYTSPPAGSYKTLYRCRQSNGEHYDSNTSACASLEGRLGYVNR